MPVTANEVIFHFIDHVCDRRLGEPWVNCPQYRPNCFDFGRVQLRCSPRGLVLLDEWLLACRIIDYVNQAAYGFLKWNIGWATVFGRVVSVKPVDCQSRRGNRFWASSMSD
jgi:hypothetical protein